MSIFVYVFAVLPTTFSRTSVSLPIRVRPLHAAESRIFLTLWWWSETSFAQGEETVVMRTTDRSYRLTYEHVQLGIRLKIPPRGGFPPHRLSVRARIVRLWLVGRRGITPVNRYVMPRLPHGNPYYHEVGSGSTFFTRIRGLGYVTTLIALTGVKISRRARYV